MDGVDGLIVLYYDSSLGVKDVPVNTETIWNWDEVTIDTEKKTLVIERNGFLNLNKALEYNLDGWTGRYGMPLEFLLSVHIATMKPDLAYDMATSFNTNVNIYLHDISGEAITAYEGENGYVDTPTLNEALNGFEGRNLITAAINTLDNLGLNNDEAQIAIDLGIVPPGHGTSCSCEFGYCYDLGSTTYREGSTLGYNSTTESYYIVIQGVTIDVSESDLYIGITKLDDDCKKYIKTVIKYLNTNNDYGFKAYQPYIASVTDHWYRDVYFVESSDATEYVTYDYDYETVMNERWTLYEQDSETGEYILYRLNEDGSTSNETLTSFLESHDEYETQEDAEKDGYTFVKKAETVSSNTASVLEDLGWSDENEKSVWTAYTENTEEVAGGYEPLYDDPAGTAEGDEMLEEILGKLYISINTSGNIVQTGEGQRTVTNSTIKKMFLQNKYFSYDGTATTAEIIEKFRNDKGIGYGALTDEELEKTVKYDADGDGEKEKYSASDYASTVSLEQDSLDAFSMLENTHTLDADYIYRDFKELIVELGYFTKEELTDETPRLLQFLVPDIGSNGFPNNTIDKNENEFGTMIHSKGDIDANEKYTLQAIVAAIAEATENEKSTNSIDGSSNTQTGAVEGIDSENTTSSLDNAIEALRASAGVSGDQWLTVGGTSSSSSTSLLSLDEWWEETQKMFDTYKSEGWVYSDHGGGESLGCNAGTTFETHGHNDVDCSIGASWMLQKLGALQDNHTFTSALGDTGKLVESDVCAQDLLDAGAEVIAPADGTKFSTAATSGELEPGDVLFYDGHVSIYCGDSYETGGTTYCWDTGSTDGIQEGGPRDTSWEKRDIELIVRLPLGNSKSGDAYEGYMGNEAVVSPVTGVLLEYGTYETEKDSVTGEEYRVNTDLLYPADGSESETVSDKVGYAKILVLDAENYIKLESTTSNYWKNNSLAITKNQKQEDGSIVVSASYNDDLDSEEDFDDTDKWDDLNKTVYGYKQFAESYESAGISGYIVYIDGFICEEVDEEFTEEDLESKIPNEGSSDATITKDDFAKITASDLKGQTEVLTPEDNEDVMESKYEKDETYKLASEKATEKANAEAVVKEQANSTITTTYNGEKITFIKEGTVLGRTMTDYELITEIRDESEEKYKEYRPDDGTTDPETGEDAEDKVMGNYVRIIFKDTDDTVVENVEDYMKLDDGETKNTDNDWALFYWLPFESGAADTTDSYLPGRYTGPCCVSSCSSGEVGVGIVQWTSLGDMSNQRDQLLPYFKENYPEIYSMLSAYSSWDADDYWSDYNGSNSFQSALLKCDEQDHETFLSAQMECAKANYLEPLLEDHPWVAERPSCVQGEIMHLKLWGASLSDIDSWSSLSDEEVIKKVRNKIANTSSTAGEATGDETTGRTWNEPEIGLRILDGTLSDEDVEQWVRTEDVTILTSAGVDYKGG